MGVPNIPVYCEACGKVIAQDSAYCPHCGAEAGSQPALCRWCKAPIDARDAFCRRCGKPQNAAGAPWYYQHWGIIALACMTGPLAIVSVWRSPVLGKTAKWAYTAAILGISLWLYLAVKTAFVSGLNAITGGDGLSSITGGTYP